MKDSSDATRKIRDYVSDRMNSDLPPDFVGDVMREVRQTPQRSRWIGWPLVAGLATVAAAVAAVAIGLSVIGPGGVGSTSPSPTVSSQPSPTTEPSEAGETPAPSVSPVPSVSAEPLPSGEFGPLWSTDPATAFADPTSCENPFGLPTVEEGENVAWRISFPGDWTTQESYIGSCRWFGPEPWETNLDEPVPPDGVAIVITLLDGRVTPGSTEFQGGTIVREERYTVDGLPAIRYEVEGSSGEFLTGGGVMWVIGAEGELPDFETGSTPNYMTIYTSTENVGRLVQQVEVLDRMVATLQITDR